MNILWALMFGAALAQDPETKKYDCLAGLCLNAKAMPAKAVTVVSDHKWTREAEICSGKIVSITISTGWVQPDFEWSNLLPGTSTPIGVGENGTAAVVVHKRVQKAMENKGWIPYHYDKEAKAMLLAHPEVAGSRAIFFERSKGSGPQGWGVSLSSIHPDRRDLCRSKTEEGL